MKKLLLSIFLLGGLFANADLVIETNVESAVMNGKMVTKIKGDQARFDVTVAQAGAMSVIIDGKAGHGLVLIHEQKAALKRSLEAVKQEAQEQEKAAGIDPAKIEKPKATGVKEKVGEWETEIFETTIGENVAKMWVAKDFPNYKVLTEKVRKLNEASGGGGYETKFDLGGMVVKSDMTLPGPLGKTVATLIKVKEEAVEDATFKAPDDYETVEK